MPVVIDGFIAGAALLAAERLVPDVAACCIAGHRSVEPGATVVLQTLGLEPVLELDLRLGEGSGACLALPIIEAAARILAEMATFDGAGVANKDAEEAPLHTDPENDPSPSGSTSSSLCAQGVDAAHA